MHLLFFTIIFILTYRFADIFPFTKLSKELFVCYTRVLGVWGNSHTNDNRKQKVLLQYSILLFIKTGYIIALLAAVTGFLVLLVFIAGYIGYGNLWLIKYLGSWQVAAVSVPAYILYYFSKKLYAKFRL